MSKMMRYAKLIVPAVVAILFAPEALALNCTSAASGNWNAGATWGVSCGAAGPTAGDVVTILNGHTVTVSVNMTTANIPASLTINSGGTLSTGAFRVRLGVTNVAGTINLGAAASNRFIGLVTLSPGAVWIATTATVNFRGGLTNNGTTFTAGTGAYTVTTAAQAFNGISPIAIPSLAVTTVALTNNANLAVATALTGTGSLVNSAAGTLNIGGTSTITTLTATAVGNIVNYTGAAQTVKATAYHHIGLSGSGAKTLTGVTVAGNLTMSGTATATPSAAFSIGGNLDVGVGTVFTSANFTNLVTGATTVSGTLAHSGAAVKTYVGAVTVNAGGTWTNAGNASVTLQGGLTHNGATFTAGTGIYTFSTTAAQSVNCATALAIPSVTVTAPTVLTNNCNLTVATALAGTGNLANGATGTLNIGGTSAITTLTATAVGNTVNYTGAAQTVKAAAYHHLGLSGSGAKTMAGVTAIAGNLGISGTATMTGNAAFTVTGALNYSSTGTTTLTALTPISIGSYNQSAGTLVDNGNTITVTGTGAGTWAQTAGIFTTTGAVIFTGAAAQIGTANFNNLTFNVGAGNTATLTGNDTVSGVLTLSSGTVSTGANTLINTASCATGVSRVNGWVNGNLQLTVPATNPVTCTFPVGDANNYAPITVTKTGTNTGTLTGTTVAGDHADTTADTSGIDVTKSVNRTWILMGGTLASGTPYSATFQFCNAVGAGCGINDVDAGATFGNFIVAEKVGGVWSVPTAGTRTATATQATGLATFGVFAVGEASVPPMVSSINLASANPTMPATAVSWTVTFNRGVTGVDAADFSLIQTGVSGASITSVTGSGTTWTVTADTGSGYGTLGLNLVDNDTIIDAGGRKLGGTGINNGNFTGQVYTVYPALTCITDNFTGADNSAPNSANWSVQNVSGTFTPLIFGNRLRITDITGNVATRVTNKNLFPFGNNLVIAEFDYWAYGGTGADGIAITFSDPDTPTSGANNPPTAGGFGGSLGYANRDTAGTCNVAGFTGGWTGVGIDEYGNYSNPNECRNGGPGFRTNAVAIRGSGSGAASPSASNYAYLTGTAALGANGVASGTTVTAYRYRITLDSVTDLAKVMVKVEQDKAGTGYLPLFSYDLKPSITAGTQAALPSRLQFTYTGSTGGSTNYHEVDNLSICAASIIPPSGLHHLEIQHGSGTGLTCTPSTLTIKACADTLVPCTPYTGGVTGTLSATGVPAVNWVGGTVFTIAAGNSTVPKDVQVTTVGSTVFGATATPAATSATTCNFGMPGCTFTSADAGFIMTAPNHVAEAVSTLTIQSVKKADNSLSCVPGMTGNKAVNLKCSYVNPATGTLPVRMGGTALNATNNTAAACDAGGSNVTLNFNASGIATPTLQYADVGSMLINASFTGTAGTVDAGLSLVGSGGFITVPASFAFSGITAGLIKAGNPFSATITARNAAGNVTPNFGKESAAEGVTLTSNLVSPAGGNNPALANNIIAGGTFVNGVATVNNLSWGDVGLITLTGNLTSGNYLTSGVASATGTSGNVGRFIPDHFDTITSGGMTCPTGLTCPTQFNGFVYSGQPFTTNVIARNLGGVTTLNYDNVLGFSKAATLSAWDAKGSITTPNPPAATPGVLGNNIVLATAFTNGATTTGTPATPTYALPNPYPNPTPTSPTDIYIRAVDTDLVTSLLAISANSVEGGIKIVSGRIKVSSAHGSELLPLPIGVTVQYWNGTNYVTSTTDSLTSFASTNVLYTNWQKNLTAGSATVSPASVVFTNGAGSFKLSAPGMGKNGSVDLTTNAPSYLPSTTGRATFGVYKGNNDFIYLRESY